MGKFGVNIEATSIINKINKDQKKVFCFFIFRCFEICGMYDILRNKALH